MKEFILGLLLATLVLLVVIQAHSVAIDKAEAQQQTQSGPTAAEQELCHHEHPCVTFFIPTKGSN